MGGGLIQEDWWISKMQLASSTRFLTKVQAFIIISACDGNLKLKLNFYYLQQTGGSHTKADMILFTVEAKSKILLVTTNIAKIN